MIVLGWFSRDHKAWLWQGLALLSALATIWRACGAAADPRLTPGRRALQGVVVLGLGSTLALGFLQSSLPGRSTARERCAMTLSSIGVAARLYAEDHGHFPHVGARDRLLDAFDVSDVYAKLVHEGYIAETEDLICSGSEDWDRADWRRQNGHSKRFVWDAEQRPKALQELMDAAGRSSPPISYNDELSYTWRRRFLRLEDLGPNTILAADKASREDFDATQGSETGMIAELESAGNHNSGLNVLYGDGRVRYVKDHDELRRVAEACVLTTRMQRSLAGWEPRASARPAQSSPPDSRPD